MVKKLDHARYEICQSVRIGQRQCLPVPAKYSSVQREVYLLRQLRRGQLLHVVVEEVLARTDYGVKSGRLIRKLHVLVEHFTDHLFLLLVLDHSPEIEISLGNLDRIFRSDLLKLYLMRTAYEHPVPFRHGAGFYVTVEPICRKNR